jgi:hypothetical protein
MSRGELLWLVTVPKADELMFYTVDEWEMNDVRNDPEEKHNLCGKPEHTNLQQDLAQRLERLVASVRRRAI